MAVSECDLPALLRPFVEMGPGDFRFLPRDAEIGGVDVSEDPVDGKRGERLKDGDRAGQRQEFPRLGSDRPIWL